MKKLMFLIILFMPFFLFGEELRGSYVPDGYTQLPPSPEVAALKKFVDFPVSYFTGQPEIDLPIYEVRQGQLSVPISVAYHGGGIKVAENAVIIGLGWSLMASANISRTVHGMPDEAKNVCYSTLLSKTVSCGFNIKTLNTCYDESTLNSFFKALRNAMPKIDLTTQTYNWIIGVSSSTDSSGITTNFSYDGFGRLESIKDVNQYFIKKFEYNYMQK